jgi:DNA polymerase elongation subunit (family B)
MVVKSNNTKIDFNATHSHLEALNHRLIELLGDAYAINLDKPEDFKLEGEPFDRYKIRCLYYTHNEAHYDRNPSGWIAVSQNDSNRLISGCWVCKRPQVIKRPDGYQPAPTLLTLSRRDPHLLKVLVVFGCKEVEEVNGNEQIAVAFPVTYADGSEGYHYRVALEGKNKWRHMEGRKAGEAVFALHRQGIQSGIQKKRFVIVTESPLDAVVLNAAGFPAIAVLGKGNAEALACDLHRETLLSLLGENGVVFVWVEPDAEDFAQEVANALQRPVKVINPPVPEDDPKALKDAFRIWLDCGKDWEKLKATISGLLQNTTEITPQPEPVIEPKIVKVKRRFEEAVWRPLGEITMPQNDRWQVEGLIKEGNLVILSARPKTAKSIVALNLAASVAMGKPFLDRSVTQGRALFVAYERYELTLKRAWAMGLADCYDFMLWDKYAWKLPRIEALDFWLEFIEKHSVRLFVVDTLAHFLRPELEKVRNAINAYDFVYKVMERLQEGASDTGCTIMLIHHDRKGETAETDEARVLGTTALTASVDVVLQLKPMSDGVIQLKASGNAIEDTVLYFRVGEDFWLELADKPATTKEEKAAKVIEDYLRQHGEATRQQLIDLMLEIGLAENKTTACKLVDRSIQDRLATKIRKEFKGRMSVYYWQGGRATSPAPLPDGDPHGGLKTTTTDIEFVSGVSNQGATRDIRDIRDNGRDVSIVSYSQPDPQRETPKTNPIGVSNVFNPDSPEGDPLAARPETDPQPTAGSPTDLFVEFFDAGILPDLIVEGSPTEPERPVGDPLTTVNPPAMPVSEPEIEFMRINSISAQPDQSESDLWERPEPTESPTDPLTTEALPANEPEDALPDQPVATLNEPTCPICGIELEPEPESGLAACLGCGRLFKVEIPPTNPDDDDETPPETPNNNGHGGCQTGFAPPEPAKEPAGSPTLETVSNPQSCWVKLPCAQAKSEVIPPDSPDEDNPPETPNNGQSDSQTGFAPPVTPSIRMTERLPDGSVKLEWQRKSETVAPDDLKGWQPIETIPDINLPDIESVEIPPVVVLDLETTDKDPKRGEILAAGLALYVSGKEVEVRIIPNEGNEAALLAQTFDYLRETCNDLGEIVLTGYNLLDFDLPYLIERSRKLQVECPFRYLKNDNGEPKRWRVAATDGTLKGDLLDYYAIVVDRDLPIYIVDTLHLVCRWDYTAKQLRNYDLKSVAAHFGFNQPDRPILSPAQIVHAFKHDPAKFKAYLLADLRETYALFAKLIPPYVGVAVLTQLPLEKVAVKSTAWVWQQILERYYAQTPQADEKRKYEGGLVVSRKGLWSPCLKIDIASLYPTIMLAYRIHSRKDTDQIALRWLKTLTQQRLVLKAKAKAGDPNAQILQEAMKILLNSLYGFYGTGGYGFNDMTAAERVTEIGRKVLTCMIAAIEDLGGIIVEADTDGLIVCYRNADPQEILQAVSEAIPPVFKVEVEWLEATVFVSDDKNYVVIDRNGDLIAVKGSKWRGRDKEAYLTQAIPTFVRIWATQGIEAALAFALQTLNEIRTGQGWRWVIRSHRVSKADKFLLQAGFKVGEIATYAYKDKKRSIVAREPEDGYDCDYYAKQFSKTLKEVVETIDPAQTNEAGEMVGTEAPSLIFGSVIAAEVS